MRRLRGAAHVTRLDTWVNRVTGVPMEPRSAVGLYDNESDRYTLYAGSGGIVRQKRELSQIFGVPFDSVRVVTHEIGGNFGTRNSFFPEFAMVVWGAKRVGRPVKWTAERHEAFVTDYMGRDLTVSAELALDAEGRFSRCAARTSAMSARIRGSYVPLVKGVGLATAGYRIPMSHIKARAVLSSTMCTTPYRSAGRPEVIYVMERLIDKAAQEHGFDRVALRKRNLIPPSAFPYQNPQGITYDNGTYRAVMDRAMELGDWKGFKKRRAEARKRKKLRGIGLCCYLETTGGYPRERADITVQPQGKVDVVVGTLSSGQSHETTFAQCVAEWLGVPFDDVNIFEFDTDIVKEGGGSHSARSMRLAGIVMGNASDAIVEKGKKIAAHMLETAEDDIAFAAGRFTVKGTDRSIGIFDAAKAAAENHKALPEDLRGPLAATADETIRQLGFPYGAHVCEVEIDPQTGALDLVRYTAVDDVGRAINPMVVRRANPRRRRAGHRPGAVGAVRLRRGRAIAHCILHGLRHAARRYTAVIHHRHQRSAHARPTSSAYAAPAKAAPPARSAPSSMPWSTRSPNSASAISKCRSRRRGSGGRFKTPSPRARGEGRGEGASPPAQLRRRFAEIKQHIGDAQNRGGAPSPAALRADDLSPRGGER